MGQRFFDLFIFYHIIEPMHIRRSINMLKSKLKKSYNASEKYKMCTFKRIIYSGKYQFKNYVFQSDLLDDTRLEKKQ